MTSLRIDSNSPGNLRELVCSSFFGELPSWRLFAAGDASLLAGVDLTACITPWFAPPCINASCGSDDSWTEHRLRSFRQRWLMLLFHRFKSERIMRKDMSYIDQLLLGHEQSGTTAAGIISSKKVWGKKSKKGERFRFLAIRPNDRKHLSFPWARWHGVFIFTRR